MTVVFEPYALQIVVPRVLRDQAVDWLLRHYPKVEARFEYLPDGCLTIRGTRGAYAALARLAEMHDLRVVN